MGKFANIDSSDDFFEMLESVATNDDLVSDYVGFKANFVEKLVEFGYSSWQIENSLGKLTAILANQKFSDGRNFLHYLIDSKAEVDVIAAFIEDVFTDSGTSDDMPITTFSAIINGGDDFGINAYDRSYGNEELRVMLVQENSCFEDHSQKARLVTGIISGSDHGALDKLTTKWSQFLDADFFNRFNRYLSKYLEPSPEGDEILQSWKRAIYFKLLHAQPDKFFELVSSQDFDKRDLAMERVSIKKKKVPLFGLVMSLLAGKFVDEQFLAHCVKVPLEVKNDQYFYNLRLCNYAIKARRDDLLYDIISRSKLSDLFGLESIVEKIFTSDDAQTFVESKSFIESKLESLIEKESEFEDLGCSQNNKVAICAIKMGLRDLFSRALQGNVYTHHKSLFNFVTISAQSIKDNQNVECCYDIICDLLFQSCYLPQTDCFLELCKKFKRIVGDGIFKDVINRDFGEFLKTSVDGGSVRIGILELLMCESWMRDKKKDIEFLIESGAEMKYSKSTLLYLVQRNNYDLMALIVNKYKAYRDELVQVCAQNQISLLFSHSRDLLGMVDFHGEVLWSDPGFSPEQLHSFGQYTHSRVKKYTERFGDMTPNQELLMLVKDGPSVIADRESFFLPRFKSLLASEQLDINHVYENCGGLKILEVAAVIGNDKFIDYVLAECDVGKIELSKKYLTIRNLLSAPIDGDRKFELISSSFQDIYKEEVARGLAPPQELNFVCLAHVVSATEGRSVVKMQTANLKGSVLASTSKAPSPEVQEGKKAGAAKTLLEMQEGKVPARRM